MKKYLCLFIIIVVLFCSSIVVAEENSNTKVEAGIGMGIIESQSNSTTLNGNIDIELEKNEFKIYSKNRLYTQRVNGESVEDIESSDVEVDYFRWGNGFCFIKIGSEEVESLTIDERYLGVGIGYEGEQFQSKIGAFYVDDKNEEDEEKYGRGYLNGFIPFGKDIKIGGSTEYRVDLENEKDYVVNTEAFISFIVTKELNLNLIYELDYANASENKNTKRGYFELVYAFET